MQRDVRVTAQSGVGSLLARAHETEQLYSTFNGDLCQMAAQKRFLETRGFTIGVTGGIPGFYTEEDTKKGLKLIWENKFQGWWNYRHEFIKLGFCTEDEFAAALKSTR